MKKNDNNQALIGKINKSNISQTQFFILFCLCFFMPATVFLPRLMVERAGNMAWLSPLLGMLIIITLFFVFHLIFKANGDGLSEKSITILGKPLAYLLCIAIMLFSIFLAAFYVRHFAERVLLVYLTDSSAIVLILGLLLVVLVALCSGVLSFARLCEVMFYVFIVVFVLVTVAGLIDGFDITNIIGMEVDDIGGIANGAIVMLLPFCIFVCMSFFGERVNWKSNMLRQGVKSSVFLSICATAVILLCVSSIGVFGTTYLQMPYFAVTRQISYLGPMKNIGSIVFSMWIISDFAVVATLCYSAAGIGQSLTHFRHRQAPIYVAVIIVFAIAVFAWRDMSTLNWFFDRVIMPSCVVVALGVPVLLLLIGLLRGKIKLIRKNIKADAINKEEIAKDENDKSATPVPVQSK